MATGHLRDGVWQQGRWPTTARQTASSAARQQRLPRLDHRGRRAGAARRAGLKAESGRYHLYVSYACPWAHRTLIFRALKGLAPHVTVDVVHPLMGTDGWSFETDRPGATGDRLVGARLLRDVYLAPTRTRPAG